MSEENWEKSSELAEFTKPKKTQRIFYLVAAFVLFAIVGVLIYQGLMGREYMTVDELLADSENMGKDIKITGVVDGYYEMDCSADEFQAFQFNQDSQSLTFWVANIPRDNDEIKARGGLSTVLDETVGLQYDPETQTYRTSDATRLRVVYENAEIPDLLQHKAHAIMSGQLRMVDGEPVFYAHELLLKCPSRHSDEEIAVFEDSRKTHCENIQAGTADASGNNASS